MVRVFTCSIYSVSLLSLPISISVVQTFFILLGSFLTVASSEVNLSKNDNIFSSLIAYPHSYYFLWRLSLLSFVQVLLFSCYSTYWRLTTKCPKSVLYLVIVQWPFIWWDINQKLYRVQIQWVMSKWSFENRCKNFNHRILLFKRPHAGHRMLSGYWI